ncbi:MAG: SAM-dependent methyltransferase [Gammaproteobacteria bacterium]|nr:MAG: SAM-dependent methyltransferase [Gammaproteobacteria bacterium]
MPAASETELALSEQLTSHIQQEIDATGPIDFARFMELALYTPGLGYYAGGREKIGERGDFITAPEVSPLFGRCLARQVRQILEVIEDGTVLEVGAGTGALAVSMLNELEALHSLPARYAILDTSGSLQTRQQEILQQTLPDLAKRVEWWQALPESGFKGIIIANEVLDAMPAQRFKIGEQDIKTLQVDYNDKGFHWSSRIADKDITQRIATSDLPAGYISEINLTAEAWVRSIADCMEQGIALLIDYGYPQHEYYLPQRNTGTLKCFYRHRTHEDPFYLPGQQDITTSVNFTAMAEAAHETGLSVLGYTSQAEFLLSLGLDAMAAEIDTSDTRAYLARTQEIKKLTLPHEMGELFKVLAIGKEIDEALLGFMLRDRRGRL